MDNEIKTWLYDIQQAIEEIDSFFADRPKLYMDYKDVICHFGTAQCDWEAKNKVK